MKIISWNVNGIRAAEKKGLLSFSKKENADIYCFQEIKAFRENLSENLKNLKGYYSFWHPSKRAGRSGVLIYSKSRPKSIIENIGDKKIDKEGRFLALDFGKYYFINAYIPHPGRKLENLLHKMYFNKKFKEFVAKLKKPIIIAADFNVAHTEKDLARPKQNYKNAMFTLKERKWFDDFLKLGFLDTFRFLHKNEKKFTWWSYRFGVREKNIGWRIDYFLISKVLKKYLKRADILTHVYGSDHCPILLEIDL